jgi:glycosyltransferase involved in cell wall biosynthesis
MSNPPRVVVVQRTIRRYRMPFFRSLRSELHQRHIQLAVVHNTPPRDQDRRKDVVGDDSLIWAKRSPARDIGIAGKSLLWQSAPRGFRKADLVVVEQANRLLLNYRLLIGRRFGGPKVALWGHGDDPHPNPSMAAERFKQLYSTQPDWWFAYTFGVADLVEAFGFPGERITDVNNSTDTQQLATAVGAVSDDQVQRLRDAHGIRGGQVGLYAGALVPEKRLDHLVQAADVVRDASPAFELVLVGDGPLALWVQEQASRRPWMHYLGQRFDDDLAKVMRLSTFLMVPTWVGLVIVDGFAAGLPLIARASAAHGPEIDYLRQDENGRLVDDGGDPRRYAEGVLAVLQDPRLLDRMRAGCRADAIRMGTDEMARRFADGIEAAIAAPRRRGF